MPALKEISAFSPSLVQVGEWAGTQRLYSPSSHLLVTHSPLPVPEALLKVRTSGVPLLARFKDRDSFP